jgi:hypothetical protein
MELLFFGCGYIPQTFRIPTAQSRLAATQQQQQQQQQQQLQ